MATTYNVNYQCKKNRGVPKRFLSGKKIGLSTLCLFFALLYLSPIKAKDLEQFQRQQDSAWNTIFVSPLAAEKILMGLAEEAKNLPDSHLVSAYNSLSVCNALLGQYEKSFLYVDSAILISKRIPASSITFFFNKALLFIETNQLKQSEELLLELKDSALVSKDFYFLQEIYEELATVKMEQGAYFAAIDFLDKSRKLLTMNPQANQNFILVNDQKTADLLLRLKQYDLSKGLYLRVISEFKNLDLQDSYLKSVWGLVEVLIQSEQYEKLDSIFSICIPEAILFGNDYLTAKFYNQQANYMTRMGLYDDAARAFEKAYSLYKDAQASNFLKIGFLNYLDFLLMRDDAERAAQLYRRHSHFFGVAPLRHLEFQLQARVFARLFEKINLPDSALFYYSRHLLYGDSLQRSNAITFENLVKLTKELAIRYDVVEKEPTAGVMKNANWALIGYFVLGFLIISSWWFGLQSLRSCKNEKERLSLALEQLQQKTRNIITQSTSMPNEIKKLQKQTSRQHILRSTSNLVTVNAQLLFTYSKELNQLKSKYKKLTIADLLLVALLLARFKTGAIAEVMEINVQSVATKKQRLMKKLNISSMPDFLSEVRKGVIK